MLEWVYVNHEHAVSGEATVDAEHHGQPSLGVFKSMCFGRTKQKASPACSAGKASRGLRSPVMLFHGHRSSTDAVCKERVWV